MAAFFCDSSAIVKRYVNETGSNFVDGSGLSYKNKLPPTSVGGWVSQKHRLEPNFCKK